MKIYFFLTVQACNLDVRMTDLSNVTLKLEVSCHSRCWHEYEPSLLKAVSAKHNHGNGDVSV
jgi:hypothetical protein